MSDDAEKTQLEKLTDAVLSNVAAQTIEVLCNDINESFVFEHPDTHQKFQGSKALAESFQYTMNHSPAPTKARLMELYIKLELKRLAMQGSEDIGEMPDEELLLQAKLLLKEVSGEAA